MESQSGGFSGGMEAFGAVRIFKGSIQKHGAQYTKYDGSVDIKSFEKVRDNYPGRVVVKYECFGHYQKRVGN